jgi:hypothetical protein
VQVLPGLRVLILKFRLWVRLVRRIEKERVREWESGRVGEWESGRVGE